MLVMWSFLTAITLIMIVAIVVTLKINDSFVPVPDPETGQTIPVDIYVNNLVQQVIGDMVFGSMGYVLIVVFVLMNSSKIVASEVEKGTLVNLLTTNLNRKSVILSKMSTFISLIFISILSQYLITIISLQIVNQLQYVDLGIFTLKAFGAFLLLLFTSGFAFLFSTLFNRNSQALGLSGAIVIISWVFQIASSFRTLDWMKYLSLNSLFIPANITNISEFSNYLGQYLTLGIGSIDLYIGAYFIFIKKDLPL
ncbi:ABC transporter permease subunit [Spiroplasma taiwanense]|uniref:ABC transporter permease n=1 Tax=Spiroplasma taiwanense CT-1 TaxID=1276220 RepID=S5LWY2_9MOLU|nr:ABC transporter permease subunit [Spiroplasma taiwanense]AGR41141.1 hypothetical protein STAIW_v1c05080 [Spiroplasma taiwanense CT-1]